MSEARILQFPTPEERERRERRNLEQEMFVLEWDIDVHWQQIEQMERRREDIKRTLGLIGLERGLGDAES